MKRSKNTSINDLREYTWPGCVILTGLKQIIKEFQDCSVFLEKPHVSVNPISSINKNAPDILFFNDSDSKDYSFLKRRNAKLFIPGYELIVNNQETNYAIFRKFQDSIPSCNGNDIYLNIDYSEYLSVNQNFLFSGFSSTIIKSFIEKKAIRRLFILGDTSVSQAIYKLSGKMKIDTLFIQLNQEDLPHLNCNDFIFIALSPADYPRLLNSYANAKMIFPFLSDIKVAGVIESLPRSGTHYLFFNLVKTFNVNIANSFSFPFNWGNFWGYETNNFIKKGDLNIALPRNNNPYIVFSHFYNPFISDGHSEAPKICLMAYFFDFIYSWANVIKNRMKVNGHSNSRTYKEYILNSSSPEWNEISGEFKKIKTWLEDAKDKFYLKYEDFFNDFDGTAKRIKTLFGNPQNKTWSIEKFRHTTERTYFSDSYSKLMDEKVFYTIFEEFKPFLKFYYPEKYDGLEYK